METSSLPDSNWMVNMVYQFNEKVVKAIAPDEPTPLEGSQLDWMVKVLREEAEELEGSTHVVDQVDALVDSIIFALGGLYRMGLTSQQAAVCFGKVMEANFLKKAGKLPRSIEGVPDAVKPEGWEPPESAIARILNVDYQKAESS